ncbi:MAG: phosphoglycerate dehydrogenase, partial [Thermomicrobiales bacterium]|nr:phosphoglycerate dehydrogenase [Thermomicrobiales bacterium]
PLAGKRVVVAARSFASTDPAPREALQRAGVTVVQPGTPPRGPELAAMLGDADGLIVGAIPLTEEHFAAAPRLRVVAMHGVGVDHIDLQAAAAHGVVVTNAPGSNDGAVADLTVGLMLACLRQIPGADRAARGGEWRGVVGEELAGKRVGILGWGRIGRNVARRLSGFDVSLLVHDPFVTPDLIAESGATPLSLEDTLAQADIVSLHLPLTPATSNLLGAEKLRLIKRGAYLINTARGGIVDEAALLTLLQSGHLRGAGLDCFAVEPPVGNPLLTLPNVVVTPHIGAQTREAIARMGAIAAENVLRVLGGEEPLYRVA